MEPSDDCYTVFTTGLQLMEQNTEPFKGFTGLKQELHSQNTDCFINIYRQLGQETDRWSVLVQVHCVSSFHCQTPLITMSHLVESSHCILSDFLWWWQYVNFSCFVDHGITLLELLKSHHSVGTSLWAEARQAREHLHSVVLYPFKGDWRRIQFCEILRQTVWETAFSQSTDSHFF